MLPSRLVFVAAVLNCLAIVTAFATPACAAAIFVQEEPQPQASSDDKAKPEAKERLELLMKHKFDRTPKGILEAWSADKVKQKKKEAKEDDKKPIMVEVTNAHKDFIFLQLSDEQSAFKKDQILDVLDDQKNVIGKIKILTIEGKEISARTEKPESGKNANKEPSESDDKSGADASATPALNLPVGEKVTIGRTVGSVVRNYTVTLPVANQDREQQESTKSTEPDAESDNEESPAENLDADEKRLADAAPDKPQPLPVKTGDRLELRPIDAKEKAKQQTERLKAEVKAFARDVSLGNWDEVKEYMATKIEKTSDAQKLYVYILNELIVSMPQFAKNGAERRQQAEANGESPPKSFLSPLDILALAEISPEPISIVKFTDRKSIDRARVAEPAEPSAKEATAENEPSENATPDAPVAEDKEGPKTKDDATSAKELSLLAKLLKQTIDAGYDMKPFHKKVEAGTSCFGGRELDKRLTAAHLYVQCKLFDDAEKMVPALEDTESKDNIYVLRILKANR